MRDVIYIGNLYTVAECILFNKKFNLIGIICEDDRVNDKLLTFSLVREVPIYRVNSNNPIEELVKKQGEGTIFIMCSYGRRVPVEKCVGWSIYNIHYAALPNYKGRHPSFWATVKGEKYIGVSIHEVTEQFDQGSIIAQSMVPYFIWENEDDVFDKLTNEVPRLLNLLNDYLEDPKNIKVISNGEGGYFKPVKEADITLNLENDSPALIFNKVRAQTRAGGAVISVENKRYRLFEIEFSEMQMDKECYIADDKLYIRYTDGICIKSTRFKEDI